MGIAAQEDIKQHEAFIFIPNNLIVSVNRVKNHPQLAKVIKENEQLLGKDHPDTDQMILGMFLTYEYLLGEKSFWWPYI